MRRKLTALLAATMLTLAAAVPAFAETLTSETDWTVAFTADAKLESNFNSSEISQFVSGLQPGDTAQVTVNLANDNADATDWYMTNKVLTSLEESAASAAGGTYTYHLAYVDPTGTETVLFSSDTVGGEDSAGEQSGLHEATNAMEGYFYLGRLASGQKGRVLLSVTLEGETQGNTYQSTLADLTMDFAVEPVDGDTPNGNTPGTPAEPGNPDKTTKTSHLTQTGDFSLVPLFVVAGAAGVILLVAAIAGRRRKHDDKEA